MSATRAAHLRRYDNITLKIFCNLEIMKVILRCVIPVVCRINQNVMCTQYVVKHNLVLDGTLIY